MLCTHFEMTKRINGWAARAVFTIYDENDKIVGTQLFDCPAENWNAFWSNFNSGTFLDRELNAQANLNATVEDSEQDYLNPVDVE